MPESSAAVTHRARNFYGRTPPPLPSCKTELDILIERHQFIRDSDEKNLSWEDALAKKTYDQLFKELAVCDLSRWKEGKVAMRWRTASEVIDGKGHFTCSNLRCKYHEPSKFKHTEPTTRKRKQNKETRARTGFEEQESFIPLDSPSPTTIDPEDETTPNDLKNINKNKKIDLQELETSFGYQEHGERKIAQVKLKLCKKCVKRMNSCSLSSSARRKREEDGRSEPVQASRKRESHHHHDSSHPDPNHLSRSSTLRRTGSR